MKAKLLVVGTLLGALCALATGNATAQNIDNMAPVVVKTVPEAGTKDVAPGVMEIKITFSKEMMDQSWSWATAWENSTPEAAGKIHYDTDHRTCILKVKLEPNKTYGWWINSQKFHNFQDPQGHSAIPYFFVFHTKAE
jgi:hypothetical protein